MVRLAKCLLPNNILDVLTLEFAEERARTGYEEFLLITQLDCGHVCLAAHELLVQSIENGVKAFLSDRARLVGEGSRGS